MIGVDNCILVGQILRFYMMLVVKGNIFYSFHWLIFISVCDAEEMRSCVVDQLIALVEEFKKGSGKAALVAM